ncbi:hypothetical protein Pmar_PMAR020246 [Perkinsus marinus ATCC 50983]|uniref:ATPase AAA-type core domain-containing protein n=1 Tax=Perkinsus marinus (strain ATCC 50983 / TXsc) TaxID=423536 RepID=C5LTZ0_PERM5|nr:hypothetical protein Pmar_PMAR020246 [Perkinsus marinus ATCC 50983]EEQ99788.1 hypothetical protein Pmar_PMAR020246 [Perkinsus marinus ATCC 50983]|eukprot:XP_002767071.1 hypothetical protein Pmar_PMAR020246 [Perkinsus marinus ATCC 50983]
MRGDTVLELCGVSTESCSFCDAYELTRRRSTMRCVSQWIRKFCGNSSATEVEEYGFNELWKKYEGCSMDMLESIVEDLSSMEDAKRVIVIRDPMACMRTVDDAAAVASGGDADVDGDDEDWGEEQSLARKSLDSTLGLVLWLARSVPIGVRIVLLVPSGATTDMFGEFCGVMRLTVGEVRDLSGSTSELPINPSGPLVGLLAHHRASRSLPHTRGGLICVSGPSGSGKTDELRRLRASVSSGKAIEVRIADVVAAELGESQRRLRKIYSELASCSRFSPTVPAVAMFDDCDLWVTSAGRVMGEILSQWTALLDVHKEDVWTVSFLANRVTDDRIENFGQAKRTLQKRLSEFSESPQDEDIRNEFKSEASPAKKAKKDIPEGVPKSVYRQMKEFLPTFDAHVSKVEKIFDLSRELFTKELLSKADVQKSDLAWELCEWLKQGARVGHKCTKPNMDPVFSSRIILDLGRQFTTCPVATRTYKVHDFASRLVIVIGLLRLFQLRRENRLSFDETNTWGVPVPLANSLWYIFNGENPSVKRMSVTSNYKLCCYLIISILALAQAPAWSFEFCHLCEDVPTMKDKELFQTLCFCGIKVSGGMEKLRGKLTAPLRPIMLNQGGARRRP